MSKWPDYISNFERPKHTDIKCIKGNFYLYDRVPRYDPLTKKTKRVWGAIRGRITPEGKLIESTHRQKASEVSSGADGANDVPGGGESSTGVGNASAATGQGAEQNSTTLGMPDHAVTWDESNAPATGNFVPEGMHMRTISEAGPSKDVMTGAVCFLYNITESIRECLKAAFQDCWMIIYVIAMLRAIYGEGGRFCRIETQYKSSYISYLYPGMDLSKENLTQLLAALGTDREGMENYMSLMCEDNELIAIVDGHRLLSYSSNIETAKLGYNHKAPYKKQINVMYLFSKSEYSVGTPSYYAQYSGSTNDMKAVENFIDLNGIKQKNVTVIGDKGCADSEIYSKLENGDYSYILGVKRGTKETAGLIPAFEDYDGVFGYQGRGIKHFTIVSDDNKTKVIIYLDLFLLANEGSSRVVRGEVATGKIVKKISKNLEQRVKKAKKAENAVARAEEAVVAAQSRVDLAQQAVDIAQRRVDEAAQELSIRKKAAEDKLKACDEAKTDLQKEKAVISSQHADALVEKAALALHKAETRLTQKKVVLYQEEKKLEHANDKVSATKSIKKQCDEAVETGNKLLAMAQKSTDELSSMIQSSDSEAQELEALIKDPITREVGTFALKTNRMDLSAEEIFHLYKQRPAIEEYFKVYDDTLGFDSSYMQGVNSEESWLFFNHISSTMAVMALQQIADSGQTKNVSFSGLMHLLRAIRATLNGDKWTVKPIEQNVIDICSRMSFDPLELPGNEFTAGTA